MSRDFDSTENAELRSKIDQAKQRLPLPNLMSRLDLGEYAKKTGCCLWHDDQHPSFSVFKGNDGFWHYKCFVCDLSGGDEITFLVKHLNISSREAIKRYLDMAGFPASRPSKSREYPDCLISPGFPECPVSPVSEGQVVDGELEKTLRALPAQDACTQFNTARTRRFKLLRDLKAMQKQIGRKLHSAELAIAFDEWHGLSRGLLDPAKTREDYEAKFLSEFQKVRFASGEGTFATALENVARLSFDKLPIIPGKRNAPESWRRLAALHREIAHLRAKPTYFLAYRDAAKVFDGISAQQASDITGALVTLGVIDFVSKGKAGLNSREATEFRYLLPKELGGS